MCGICGIAYTDPRRSVEEPRLLRMRESLAHRGPDGSGNWLQNNVGIGHRRLSIIDLDAGQQPLSNETGEIWVTFNGEIYNYRELTRDLVARGHQFRTRSDTEVLVHGYEEYGPQLFERLNGIFAFALYDLRQRRLVVVRDQLGIKPLFYATTSEGFFFGSEIKAVLAGSQQRAVARQESIQEYLTFRYMTGEATFFEGVKRLPPGHFLVWQEGKLSCEEYWRPQGTLSDCTLADAQAALHDHLERAVGMQLMSDVPLGAFCSGGVDSGLVTGYAAHARAARLDTFSIGFEDPAWDETPLARETANRFGTNHHTLTLRATEFGLLLPTLIRYNDEPLSHPNSVPLYLLSRFARDHVTVVLTGEGADELFGGYPRYHIARLQQLFGRVAQPFRVGATALMGALPGHRSRKAGDLLAMTPEDALLFNSAYVHPAMVARLTGGDVRAAVGHRYRLLRESLIGNDPVATLCRYELRTYLVCALERMDRMSMAHGLEGRVPFLDVNLVEWAVRLGSRLKLLGRSNKRVVKSLANRMLSRRVVHARKSGFGVPLASWLRTPEMAPFLACLQDPGHPALAHFDAAALRHLVAGHLSGRHDHSEALWMLINVYLWYDVHTGYMSPLGNNTRLNGQPAALIAPGGLAHLSAVNNAVFR